MFVAIFWNRLNSERKNFYERMKAKGLRFVNIISPTAVVRGIIAGDNCWINDLVVIQSNAIIQSDTYIMDMALIGCFSVIGKHSHIGASSTVCGAVILGEQCFTGVNAVIFDGVRLGKKCIAGACSAVKKDMPDNTVCKISSDNMIYRTYEPEIIESKLIVTAQRKPFINSEYQKYRDEIIR